MQARRELYNEYVKTKPESLVDIYKVMVDAQKEPYETRASIEAGGMPAIVEYFKSKGLNEADANRAAGMQAILRDVDQNDNMMASSRGRGWRREPLYAPLSHSGRFRVIARDVNVDVVMARGFEKASDAAMFYTELKKAGVPNGVRLENVERSQVNDLKGAISELMLEAALPDYLKKQVMDVETNMEVARRKFEMERRANPVAGYLGEDLGDPKTGYGKRQRQALVANLV